MLKKTHSIIWRYLWFGLYHNLCLIWFYLKIGSAKLQFTVLNKLLFDLRLCTIYKHGIKATCQSNSQKRHDIYRVKEIILEYKLSLSVRIMIELSELLSENKGCSFKQKWKRSQNISHQTVSSAFKLNPQERTWMIQRHFMLEKIYI